MNEELETRNWHLDSDVERLEESNELLLASLKHAYKFIESITDALGPYKYVNGTDLVVDAYEESNAIREVLEQIKGTN